MQRLPVEGTLNEIQAQPCAYADAPPLASHSSINMLPATMMSQISIPDGMPSMLQHMECPPFSKIWGALLQIKTWRQISR
jgi:hypothetical protein